jgi:hypothetical protein
MKRDDQGGPPAEQDGDPEQQDRRSRQRVDDKQRSGRGSATALSRLKMLERRYQLPLEADGSEKS